MNTTVLEHLRFMMDRVFSEDTAVPGGWNASVPSSGHCAVAAIVVRSMYGGQFVSAVVNGQSHWFNRVGDIDIDLTGDQFGRPRVQVGGAGELYEGTRVRNAWDLNGETESRAKTFTARLREGE